MSNFIVAVGMGIVTPALPIFATSFGVGVAAASFVISVVAMMRIAFAPVSGRLVAVFGERPTFIFGLIIVAFGTAACAFAASYWQLILFRALSGIGSGMFTVSAATLMLRLAPPQLRARATSVCSTSFLLGSISGPFVGGVMVGFSLRLPFLTYGMTLFVAAVVGWTMLRKSTLATLHGAAATLKVRTALGHPTYRAALLSNLSFGWALFGVRIALVPLFVVEALRSSKAIAGVALSIFVLGNAAALMISGRVADKYGRKPIMLVGLTVAALGTGTLGLGDSIPWLLTTSFISGVGAGLINPAHYAAVADIVGKGRGGPVLATFQMAEDVGTVVGPLAAGFLVDTVSYPAAFGITGLTLVLALLFWLCAPETLLAENGGGKRSSGKLDS